MKTLDLFEESFDHLTVQGAASLLNVSTATINNWLKLGVLESTHLGNKKVLLKKTVEELKDNISKGRSEKLQKRANKKYINKL